MTTSGSVDFSVNMHGIAKASLEMLGVLGTGQTMSAEDLDRCTRWLNLIVKQWQGTADFAPGLKVWSRKRGYMFLQKGQAQYSLGPSGDNATSSYTRTTVSANEALGQTTISVTSTTGMTAADYIGIVQDNGYIHWSTIASTGAGPTVTINAATTAAASAGNYVYWYTTKMRRPIEILTASLRDSSSQDTPLYRMDLYQYEDIADKQADGTPTSWFYEAQLTNGVIYLDVEPTDVTDVIRFVFLSNIEDFDASTDTPDYPQEYYLALVMELAKYLAPVYGVPFTQDMMDDRNAAVQIAKNLNPETTLLHFQPGGL